MHVIYKLFLVFPFLVSVRLHCALMFYYLLLTAQRPCELCSCLVKAFVNFTGERHCFGPHKLLVLEDGDVRLSHTSGIMNSFVVCLFSPRG